MYEIPLASFAAFSDAQQALNWCLLLHRHPPALIFIISGPNLPSPGRLHTSKSCLFFRNTSGNSTHRALNRHYSLEIMSMWSLTGIHNSNNFSFFNFRMCDILKLKIFLMNTNAYYCCQALPKVWFITSCLTSLSRHFDVSITPQAAPVQKVWWALIMYDWTVFLTRAFDRKEATISPLWVFSPICKYFNGYV